jgi:hypothetical protein
MGSPGSNAGPKRSAHLRQIAAAALLTVLLGAVVAACGSSSSSSGIKGASEVAAQPVSTPGQNPFMPTVGKDRAGLRPPAAASSSSGPATFVGSMPGLYGGTRNISSCDARQMVAYLQQNPSKASAWASTLGIRTDQISGYVSKLTNVLLRTDTRITNHGYVNGQADGFQAVLQAGTAVLVNQYGQPVTKCYCGNPLTPPTLLSSPTYTGPTWDGFSTTNITIIQQSTTIINTYVLYDPDTGKTFTRKPGEGGTDGPYQQGTPNTGTNAAPTPSPNPSGGGSPSGGGQPSGPASVSLSPNPVTAGGTVTLSGSGFTPNGSVTINVHRPDGGDDPPRTATADSQGNVSYPFPNAGGSLTGNYTVSVSDSSGHSASGSITVVAAGGGSQGGPQTPGNTPTQ